MSLCARTVTTSPTRYVVTGAASGVASGAAAIAASGGGVTATGPGPGPGPAAGDGFADELQAARTASAHLTAATPPRRRRFSRSARAGRRTRPRAGRDT